MVLTESTMLPLGSAAPTFSLPEPCSGKTVNISETVKENGLLVAFICNHCPFVKLVADQLGALGKDLAAKSVGMVGISANDANNYPEDAPSEMAKYASSVWSSFPYLFDESQEVAKSYRAACTPDFYLFDKDLKLVYRGQLDGARPGNGKTPDGSSIRAAVDELIAGNSIPESDMRPSIGCNIKWIAGNEPNYYG